jgi:hypothetical protein
MAIVKRPDFKVRHMNLYDNENVLEVCSSVGITVGNNTNITMLKIDNRCIFIAEDTDSGKY